MTIALYTVAFIYLIGLIFCTYMMFKPGPDFVPLTDFCGFSKKWQNALMLAFGTIILILTLLIWPVMVFFAWRRRSKWNKMPLSGGRVK